MLRPLILLCTALLTSTLAVAAEPSPREYSETLLNNFKKLKPGKNSSPAEKAANDKVIGELDRSFDFQGMTSKLMQPRLDKFTAAEKEAFRSKFHDLIKAGTFVDSSDFFRKAKLEFLAAKEVAGATLVPVHVTIAAEDTDTTVGLLWKNEGGQLKVVDVQLDGDSLVKDYQNQVARIVDKKGVPGLLKTLDEKRANAEKAKTK